MFKRLFILTLILSFSFSAPIAKSIADKVSQNVYNQFNLDKRFSYDVKSIEDLTQFK